MAARPRRNSGVITLPDGAIVDGSAGTGGGGGTGGSSGSAGSSGSGGAAGGGGEVDAGIDAMVMVDAGDASIDNDAAVPMDMIAQCGQIVTQASSIVAPDAVFTIPNESAVIVASGGDTVTVYADDGFMLVYMFTPLQLSAPERIEGIDVNEDNRVIVVGTSRGGISTSGRVHIVDVNGLDPHVWDLIDYTAYVQATSAFNPTGGLTAVQDGFPYAVVEERSLGNLLVFDTDYATPVGFLGTSDASDNPLSGVTAMAMHDGFLVAALDHPLMGEMLRVFDVRDPGQITQVDQMLRPGRVHTLYGDPRGGTFYLTTVGQRTVDRVSIDSEGMLNPISTIATTREGSEARAVTIVGPALVVASPRAVGQTVDGAIDVFRIEPSSFTPLGVIDLPDTPESDYGGSMAANYSVYSAGGVLNVIDLRNCAVD